MATIAELPASSLAALKQVQQSEDFTIIKSGAWKPDGAGVDSKNALATLEKAGVTGI